MRWATYRVPGRSEARIGLVENDTVFGLDAGITLIGAMSGDGGLTDAAERARRNPAEVLGLDELQLQPPIPRPPSLRDFYAFEDHVRTARERRGLEMDPDWYALPVFYFSSPHVMLGPGDPVAAPPGCEELDFELEVAAVIGRSGSNLSVEEAEAAIAGFTVMNDWSARDLQRREMRQGLGPAKGKDFATSLGPFLVTVDDLEERRAGKAFDLTMTATVNGVEYSRGNLAAIHWSFGEMIAHASAGSRVEVGDVIGSGTVGTGCILELASVHGPQAFPWLAPGDVVELVVEELGSLANSVAVRAWSTA